MEQRSDSALRVWNTFSWLSVVALLALGAWWMCYLPTVGKGGLFLAIGAVLMPLFWDKIGTVGKMSWIAMLFLLLAVEYRAIDKEHQENIDAQKEIAKGFDKVLTDQQASFAALITQSQDQFQHTIQQESAQFKTTMDRFSRVTNKQTELSRQQQEMFASAHGHLLPGNESTPSMESLGCTQWVKQADLNDDYYFVALGGWTYVVKEFPFSPTFVEVLSPPDPGSPIAARRGYKRPIVTLTKTADGAIMLSLDIRDKSAAIMIKYDEDGFDVASQFFKRNPDKSTLIVTDQRGQQVLKVVYANKHYLRLEAHIVLDGAVFYDTEKYGHLCASTRSPLTLYSMPD